MPTWVGRLGVVLLALLGASVADGSDLPVRAGPSDAAFVSSDLMAGFIVAYKDYEASLRAIGRNVTISAFPKQHYGVTLTKENGNRARIVFFPEEASTSGGIEYDVDLNTYVIVRKAPSR